MKKYYSLLLLILNYSAVSQLVQTVAVNVKIVDGMHVDSKGLVYTTPGGLQGGREIGVVDLEGNYSVFKDGFLGPIDIVVNDDGVFYVTNYDNNTLRTFDPDTDQIETILTNLDGPAGLEIDDFGNVYLSNFGAPPAYDGKTLYKIFPDGTSEIFIENQDFFRPQGLTFASDGYLYLGDAGGVIYQIDTANRSISEFASIGVNIVNLEFGRGRLFAASSQTNRIYTIDLEGNFQSFAGELTPGGNDGSIEVATFNRPLGVEFTQSEDTLYISEGIGRLRRIIFIDEPLDQTITSSEVSGISYGDTLVASANSDLTVDFELIEGTASINENELYILDTGRYTLNINQGGSEFFNPAPQLSLDFHVAQANLKVIAEDITIIQDSEIPELSIRYEGFKLGENASVINTQPTLSTDADPTTPGTYSIILEGGIDNHYILERISGTLTVLPPLSVTDSSNPIIYPNPAPDKIHFTAKVESFKIFDLSGQTTMRNQNFMSSEIDISQLDDGVYYIEYVISSIRHKARIVKNN